MSTAGPNLAKRTSPSRPQRRRFHRELALLTVCSAALFLVFVLIFGENGYIELRKKEADIWQMESLKLQQMELNRQLEREIRMLKSDPGRIERLAREELKMARDGEVIIHLPESPAEPGR